MSRFEGESLFLDGVREADLDPAGRQGSPGRISRVVDGASPGLYMDSGSTWEALALMGAGGLLAGIPWVNVQDPQFGAKGDGVTNDTAAVVAAAAAADHVIFPDGTYLIDPHLIPRSSMVYEGLGLATIKKRSNGHLLEASGKTNVTIRGLIIDGNRSGGFTGRTVHFAAGSHDGLVEGCVISNAETIGIEIDASSRVRVLNNKISNHDGTAVFAEHNALDLVIADNYVDASNSDGNAGVVLHSTTAGQNVSGLIRGNVISSYNNFCIEVGAFGGDTPSDVRIIGNACTSVAATAFGGISIDTATGPVIQGNTILTTVGAPTISGIELVKVVAAVVTGNSIEGGSLLNTGISVNRSRLCTISGNTIRNLLAASSTARGINAPGSGTEDGDSNVISDNVIYLGAGIDAAATGIRLEANNAGNDCSNCRISGNIVVGDGTNGRGIAITRASGTMSGTSIFANTLVGLSQGINQNSDTETTVALNRFVTVATQFAGTAGANSHRVLNQTGTATFALGIGTNIGLDTGTGTKLGTSTTQKLGFWNAAPVVQPAGVADATGGATIDAEARAAINALITRLESIGIIATI